MATKTRTSKRTSSKRTVTKEDLMTYYMNEVLENEQPPTSIYKFCKQLTITEEKFYSHFGSFEVLQKHIWLAFFDQAIGVINKSKEYDSFGKREKLLTFYFTIFEVLTLNRSYILLSLKNPLDIAQLSLLRSAFQEYILDLSKMETENKNFKQKYSAKAIKELGWSQFLVILRFWIKDGSPGFEKTDVMIEKTINTTFDVVDTTPIDRVVDYVKFLIKEGIGQ